MALPKCTVKIHIIPNSQDNDTATSLADVFCSVYLESLSLQSEFILGELRNTLTYLF